MSRIRAAAGPLERVAAVASGKAQRLPGLASRKADHLEELAHLVLVDQAGGHRPLGQGGGFHIGTMPALRRKRAWLQ